jgi:hypothetical protein
MTKATPSNRTAELVDMGLVFRHKPSPNPKTLIRVERARKISQSKPLPEDRWRKSNSTKTSKACRRRTGNQI